LQRSAHRLIAACLIAGALLGLAATVNMTRPAIRGQLTTRTGVTLQLTAADCGLAALATWATLRGVKVGEYSVLLRRHPVPAGGFSLQDLSVIARQLGLQAAPWQLSAAALDTIELPVVLHLRSRRHFVVLVQRAPTWLVADPAIGVIRTTRVDVLRAFSGSALLAVQAGSPAPSA
jgi:ABC-type bacteriocin/lantibiotic exporter with double-glycine peptidase domain